MCPFCACNMRGIRELETHMHATHAHFNYVVASRGSKVVSGKKCGLKYIRKSKMDEYVMQVRCEDAHLKYARLGEGGAGSRLIEDEDDGSETEWFFAHGGWYVGAGTYRIVRKSGAFYTLVPIRPQWRGERRSLRTFAGASLRPALAFNPRPRRLSTPTDAYELHPDIRSYGPSTLRCQWRSASRARTESARYPESS
jgi:hypothetical protein